MLTIFIDADACPVKDEIYRVARRYSMRVTVVANAPQRTPVDPLVELVVCPGFGAADDWIAERIGPRARFDLLVSEIFLSGLSGVELLKRARDSSPDTAALLRAMGQKLAPYDARSPEIARVEAILIDGGWLQGASDGRGSGKAEGY